MVGYFPEGYWTADYWEDDYWADYGFVEGVGGKAKKVSPFRRCVHHIIWGGLLWLNL